MADGLSGTWHTATDWGVGPSNAAIRLAGHGGQGVLRWFDVAHRILACAQEWVDALGKRHRLEAGGVDKGGGRRAAIPSSWAKGNVLPTRSASARFWGARAWKLVD